MIRCEVDGCSEFLPGNSCSAGWSQVGTSRFLDAPSQVASYCPKHEREAIAQVTHADEEKIEIAKREYRKEHIEIAKREVEEAKQLLAYKRSALRSLLG